MKPGVSAHLRQRRPCEVAEDDRSAYWHQVGADTVDPKARQGLLVWLGSLADAKARTLAAGEEHRAGSGLPRRVGEDRAAGIVGEHRGDCDGQALSPCSVEVASLVWPGAEERGDELRVRGPAVADRLRGEIGRLLTGWVERADKGARRRRYRLTRLEVAHASRGCLPRVEDEAALQARVAHDHGHVPSDLTGDGELESQVDLVAPARPRPGPEVGQRLVEQQLPVLRPGGLFGLCPTSHVPDEGVEDVLRLLTRGHFGDRWERCARRQSAEHIGHLCGHSRAAQHPIGLARGEVPSGLAQRGGERGGECLYVARSHRDPAHEAGADVEHQGGLELCVTADVDRV